LKESVWFYYQLIGTQNPNLNDKPNGHLGPGVIGAQASNVQNLINTTLESYTQKGVQLCALPPQCFSTWRAAAIAALRAKLCTAPCDQFSLIECQRE
jgi:hypothetical protein